MKKVIEFGSKSKLLAHIVLAVKYRKKLLDEYGVFIKKSFLNISEQSEFKIKEMEFDKDHIHLLVSYSSKYSISSIVRKLKQISSYELYQNYSGALRQHFWKRKVFWNPGYFVSSVGENNEESISRYIREQGL
jgi:putative transposase